MTGSALLFPTSGGGFCYKWHGSPSGTYHSPPVAGIYYGDFIEHNEDFEDDPRSSWMPSSPANQIEYTYKPLPKDNLRLLRLLSRSELSHEEDIVECQLLSTPLNNTSNYQALSYFWGSSQHKRNIKLNGCSFPVRANLEAALKQIRTGAQDIYLWVDAICINQDDELEKTEQVKKMGSIYSIARRVIVWLGQDEDSDQDAFNLLARFNLAKEKKDDISKIINDPMSLPYFAALGVLFCRPYWFRIWIVQEVALARDIVVYCGPYTIAWSDLIDIQDIIFSSPGSKCYDNDLELTSRLTRRGPINLLNGQKQLNTCCNAAQFCELLFWHRTKYATEPRDKIYGLLSLASDVVREGIPVDYSRTIRQIYTDTTLYLIRQSKRLDIISSLPRNDNSLELPSWVPDFGARAAPWYSLQTSRGKYAAASGDNETDIQFIPEDESILVTGITLDHIGRTGNTFLVEGDCMIGPAMATFREWYNIQTSFRGNELQHRQEFCRTLLVNRNDYNHTPWSSNQVDTWSQLFDSFTQLSLLLGENFDSLLDMSQVLSYAENITTQMDPHCMALLKAAWFNMNGRRFFVSRLLNFIGLADFRVKEGDLICILMGHDVPVLLRPEGNYYTLIGEAYADGYCEGQAIKELQIGNHITESFRIR